MKNIRLTLMCVVGLACLAITSSAGCATTLDESARTLNDAALVVDDTAKASVVSDRLTQEGIVAAARDRAICATAARQYLATYRQKRAPLLQTVRQTRSTLVSAANTLDQLPPSIAANDTAIDAELASLQR